MPRIVIAVLSASLVVSAASAAAQRPARAGAPQAAAAPKIVLGGRKDPYGPWRRYLWLKLDRFDITSFTVCGAYGENPKLSPTCQASSGASLPAGSRLRLEQRRAKPVWKTVAVSFEPALQAVLSNTVAGNRRGTVTYRVTLRSRTGQRLATSNAFRVFWSR